MLGSNNYLGLTGDARVKQAAPRGARPLRHRADRLAAAERHDPAARRARARDRRLDARPTTRSSSPPATRPTSAASARSSAPADTVIAGLRRPRLDHRRLQALGRALRPFRHNRLDKLETMLERAAGDGGGVLVVVDGVYSMEGDVCDLASRRRRSAERYGARLMVDEAHGVGVLGARGAGACELFGVEDRVDLRMGTFSKSLAQLRRLHRRPGRGDRLPADRRPVLPLHRRRGAGGGGGRARGRAHLQLGRGPRAVRPRARQRAPTCTRASASSGFSVLSRPARSRTAPRWSPRSCRSSSATTCRGGPLEGALGRGRVHQRGPLPRRPAGRRADPHERDGDP